MTKDPKSLENTVMGALNDSSREGSRFTWTPSNNSFTFNFFSDGSAVQTGKTQIIQESGAPVDSVSLTGQGAGFAFNFKIPLETENRAGSAPEVVESRIAEDGNSENLQKAEQSSKVLHSVSKSKKLKNKKQKAEGAQSQRKHPGVSQSSAASDLVESVGVLTPEQQLARELDWCIEQLELGLMTQKATPKQMGEASHALRTLRSSKAPLVKKRQAMRSMFGDYRKKMDVEKAKQAKLIQAAVKTAHVTAVSEPAKRPVFHRKAECRREKQASRQNSEGQKESPVSNRETFVFTSSQEQFCFNFF